MSSKILFMLIISLVLVSCNNIGNHDTASIGPEPKVSSVVPPTLLTPVPTEFSPDFLYEDMNALTNMTEKAYGFRLTFPSEFRQIINVGGEGQAVYFYINFDFTREPYNGQLNELCSSYISIKVMKKDFPYIFNPDKDERSRTVLKADDDSDLYIIEKYQTSYATGFSFAKTDIPCEGELQLERDFYDEYETKLTDMLKSMTIVSND